MTAVVRAGVRAHDGSVRAFGFLVSLTALGCWSAPGPEVDAGATGDAPPEIDATARRLDVGGCHGLVERAATLSACSDGSTTACEVMLDAPSFDSTAICAAAAASGEAMERLEGPLAFEGVDCSGMTLRSRAGELAIRFGDVRSAADLLANATITDAVVSARVEGGVCTALLSLADGGSSIELHDLPSGGGTLLGGWLGDVRAEPISSPSGSCPAMDRLCFDTAPTGFAMSPCGGNSLPIGGCGDAMGAGYLGAASCGGRIHFAIFSTPYVRICH